MTSTRRRMRRGERGAFLIVFALCITALVLIVAMVIDLGATRSDRRGGQLAVDNAAVSAAQTMARTGSMEEACDDVYDIVASTLEVSAFTGQSCSGFPLACPAGGPQSTLGTSGPYTLTVRRPVADTSPLMVNTSTIDNEGISASSGDGQPCDRIGVELTTSGEPFFGGIAGSTQRTSKVHAVGRVGGGSDVERPLNLLALERFDCGSFVLTGLGDVIVASTVNSLGVRQPGTAAVDSNGTESCPGNAATLEATGQGSLVAHGPCPMAPATECTGTGRIPLMAPFTSGSCAGTGDLPGCREGAIATITPTVEAAPARFTRAPIDYRFNCKSSYASEPWYTGTLRQDIPGCPTATASSAYIDGLKSYVAAITAMNSATRLLPANGGWQTIGGSNPACSVQNTTYIGNVFVDCDRFRPGPGVVFAGGNVIFRQDVEVSGSGSLTLHAPCPAPVPVGSTCATGVSWTAGANFDESQASNLAGWVSVGRNYDQSGGTTNGRNTALVFPNATGRLSSTGGNFTWEAPNGVGPFDDLAVWSEGTSEHSLGGNGSITLIGTLFTGQATFNYAGGSPQTMNEAQFVANKLRFTGGSSLRMSPEADRNVSFPIDPTFNLIR